VRKKNAASLEDIRELLVMFDSLTDIIKRQQTVLEKSNSALKGLSDRVSRLEFFLIGDQK